MKSRLRGNRVGVQKIKKPSNKNDAFGLKIPEQDEFCGIIKYLGPDASKDLKEGQVVYFGDKSQQCRMDGSEIIVMADDNVLAINDEKTESSAEIKA